MNILFKILKLKKSKIFRYIFSGIIASLFNFLTLYLLVNQLHFWYLISSVISFSCGIIASYCLHKFFTFKDNSINIIPIQFFTFLIYNLIMLSLNTFLMYLFVDIIGFWYIFSQIVISGGMAFINYMFFNKILFNINRSIFICG